MSFGHKGHTTRPLCPAKDLRALHLSVRTGIFGCLFLLFLIIRQCTPSLQVVTAETKSLPLFPPGDRDVGPQRSEPDAVCEGDGQGG